MKCDRWQTDLQVSFHILLCTPYMYQLKASEIRNFIVWCSSWAHGTVKKVIVIDQNWTESSFSYKRGWVILQLIRKTTKLHNPIMEILQSLALAEDFWWNLKVRNDALLQHLSRQYESTWVSEKYLTDNDKFLLLHFLTFFLIISKLHWNEWYIFIPYVAHGILLQGRNDLPAVTSLWSLST